ncbi:transmembrane sensor/regulator PpyR [Pseudomonas citronellolis]|uniref:transmembrane sensor/regulator PpyR n=1 Tax=Pseudomonas citronellolis TaxID=53408 RepID=UPI0023E39A66|nr:transmembrane sensor/regulator PpyR [Pseudomonas citronellolis]MDF3936639.1 transmembrane sensor/regulator PpyR [Pseudomonas citronellolis]
MKGFFSCPQRNLGHSSALLSAGVAMLLGGIYGAYFIDQLLALPLLVAAHALTILGPTAIKLGYVLRLIAQHQMRRDGWEACCVAA